MDEHLTYLSAGKLKRLEDTASRVVEGSVEGDFVEFGVALGGSATVLAAKAASDSRGFHGFDVFGTIPPPTEMDGDDSMARYDTIVSGRSKGLGQGTYYGYRDDLYEDVVRAFKARGLRVDGKAVRLHKGLFEQTWSAASLTRVALAHIDCDWYDPVAFCLSSLAGVLSDGAAIVIDDYHDFEGARRAVDEFLRRDRRFSMEPGRNPVLWMHS